MIWRTIPDFEAYEVSQGGTVRRRSTKCRLHIRGRKYQLWDGNGYHYLLPSLLVARAFGQSEAPVGIPAPDPLPDADELAWLRAKVAELEAEVAKSRTPAARKPARKPAPTPTSAVPARTETTEPAKPGQKKRYCVVCGRLLPSGFWRRCPEHAFREGVHTEDDFSGSVAL